MLWPVLAVLISVAVVSVAIVSLYVDDWQRDFTTNHAATSDNPKSPLPAFRSELTPAELANHAMAVMGKVPRWRLSKLDEGDGEVTLHFVHATRLARFADDVTVRVSPEEEGSILRAESRSRIGKGDLGQNPRNLRELLEAVKAKPSTSK
jgi:uncharacterized protein (DUF1499 family)